MDCFTQDSGGREILSSVSVFINNICSAGRCVGVVIVLAVGKLIVFAEYLKGVNYVPGKVAGMLVIALSQLSLVNIKDGQVGRQVGRWVVGNVGQRAVDMSAGWWVTMSS